MNRLILTLCFILFASTSFCQQFLWSTINDSSTKYVPIENITDKVLDYYDHYKVHYDGSGYNKTGFFKEFEKSKSFKSVSPSFWKELKQKIIQINSPMAFAFKDNSGHGSEVMVMCISKDNVNMIVFSNNYEPDALLNYSTEREKFAKWFKTLLE